MKTNNPYQKCVYEFVKELQDLYDQQCDELANSPQGDTTEKARKAGINLAYYMALEKCKNYAMGFFPLYEIDLEEEVQVFCWRQEDLSFERQKPLLQEHWGREKNNFQRRVEVLQGILEEREK